MTNPFKWQSEDRPSVILQDPTIRASRNRSAAAASTLHRDRAEGRSVDLAFGRRYRKKPSEKPGKGGGGE